jgi:hypothetical protein
MMSHPSIYLGLIAFAAITGATQENSDTTASTVMATRLADAQQCPVSPRPTFSEDNCQGSIFVSATQFVCSNQNPFNASDGRSVILAGCRCCPLPIQVWCHDHHCAAPEGTRICVAESLEGCSCMTGKDRLAAVEAAAEEDYVWRSDDSVELDLEPSSDEEGGTVTVTTATSFGQYAALATMTMEPLQLWSLQDFWSRAC